MKFSTLISLFLLIPFSVSADNGIEESIAKALSRLIPEVDIDSVQESAVKGLYQVMIGADVIYMTHDGNYVFRGELLDINNRQNLTELARAKTRVKLLKAIGKGDYIEFSANESAKHTIYVFTDIDCGYCRKLHREVPELNKRGVNVRYLAYPRAGMNSTTARNMRYIWCADDRQKALTDAKNGQKVTVRECDGNAVAEQYELGQKLGVRGTPAIFLKNGKMLPGYMPPDELISQLQNLVP